MAKTYRLNVLARFGNLMSGAMIRTGIAPGGMHLLTVRGRRSGMPRTTPVNVIEYGGQRWLVAPYGQVGWVRNVRDSGQVTLRRGSRAEHLNVREVSPEEAAPVLRAYVRKLKLIVGPYFDVAPGASDDAFIREADRHPVFRID